MSTEAEQSSVGLLELAYGGLLEVVAGLSADELTRPTRAAGWTVVDLLFHLLLDAQRVLVTVASPTDAKPDRDAISYWRGFAPGRPGSVEHADFVRRSVRAYSHPTVLIDQFVVTLSAAVRAARACDPHMRVCTQRHVLTLTDFCSTVVLEAAVHHLDVIVGLPAARGPDTAVLSETRRILTGLLGAAFPASWSDTDVVLRATGREQAEDHRLPLIG